MNGIKYFLVLFFFSTWNYVSAQSFEFGNTYYDINKYVEYLSGNLPIIISVPHGGDKKPSEIADRDCSGCIIINDSYTQELGRKVAEEIIKATGCYPHIVINRLHRSKLDANRNKNEGADGNPLAEDAWESYYRFLDSSMLKVISDFGEGLFIDLHGHGHDIQRLELGYLITKEDLQNDDDHINKDEVIQRSSIRNLVSNNLSGLTHAKLIRGNLSLGTLLEDNGYASVPSESDTHPDNSESYFRGGYNTDKYGSKNSGAIDGIQIECNQDVRFVESERNLFGESLALTLLDYIGLHYIENFEDHICKTSLTNDLSKSNYNIFPNPTVEIINIKSDFYPIKVMLSDQQGKILRIETLERQHGGLKITSVPPGLYFLTIMNGRNQISTSKIVKM